MIRLSLNNELSEGTLGFDITPITSRNNNVAADTILDGFLKLSKAASRSLEMTRSLKEHIQSYSLWTILSSIESSEYSSVSALVTRVYFSLPSIICSAFKTDCDEFFVPNSFQSHTLTALEEYLSCNSPSLKQFVPALAKFTDFGVGSLANFPFIWDSFDSVVLETLSERDQDRLLSSMLLHFASKYSSQRHFGRLIERLISNMAVNGNQLVRVIESMVHLGSISHEDFASLLVNAPTGIHTALLANVLKLWSNKSWISRTPSPVQLHFSTCLISILSMCSPFEFQQARLEFLFLEGIQERLDHSDPQIRLISMCLAETLNSLTIKIEDEDRDKKLDFGLDSTNEVVKHLRNQYYLAEGLSFTGIGPILNGHVATNVQVAEVTNDNDIACNDEGEVDDLKPIASLLQENDPKNANTKAPMFLSDCLKTLRINDDHKMVECALDRLENIYSKSSKLTREMHAVSAFNTLSALSDRFELPPFEQLRLVGMQTILSDQVKLIAPIIIDGIFTSNRLVLDQKMGLLMAIASTANSTLSNADKSTSFIDHLYIPLLKCATRNFHIFTASHSMLVDKFLFLQGILLSVSRNNLRFDQLVSKYLDFALLCIRKCSDSLLLQGPIKKSLLFGILTTLSNWPTSLSLLQNFSLLQEIHQFIQSQADPSTAPDQEVLELLSSTAVALNSLLSPERMLRESTESLSLDIKEIKLNPTIQSM